MSLAIPHTGGNDGTGGITSDYITISIEAGMKATDHADDNKQNALIIMKISNKIGKCAESFPRPSNALAAHCIYFARRDASLELAGYTWDKGCAYSVRSRRVVTDL